MFSCWQRATDRKADPSDVTEHNSLTITARIVVRARKMRRPAYVFSSAAVYGLIMFVALRARIRKAEIADVTKHNTLTTTARIVMRERKMRRRD